jgi:NADPH2:quinone reductase
VNQAADTCLLYPDDSDYDTISSSIINPLTACGFIDLCLKNNVTSIVQDLACSSLGKMVGRMAPEYGIDLISIVRRQEQVDTLENMGQEHVLNSSTKSFWDDLDSKIQTLAPMHYYSGVGGGDIPGRVLGKMPRFASVFVFGAQGMDYFKYKPGNFIFSQHSVCGFWLGSWMETLTDEERNKWFNVIVDDLSSGGEVFGSTILETYPLNDFQAAIDESHKVASQGKIILKP